MAFPGFRGCPECPYTQLITWPVFIIVLIISWDMALPSVINRMNDYTDDAEANDEPIRRTFLFALIAYALAMVWFRLLFIFMLGYLGCSVIAMMANYAINPTIEKLMVWLSNPNFVFNSVATTNIPFHAFVLLLAIAYAAVPITNYITTDDLTRKTRTRAKTVRVLFAVPFFMFSVYVIYGLYRLVLSF